MKIDEVAADKTPMQNIKQRFFALRNGVVADMLRKAGSPYRIIFGLNLPQLREVAAAFSNDNALATELWNNVSTRESRLIAPMLVDRDCFTLDDARRWLETLSGSPEEVDILCWALLRHIPGAVDLAGELMASDNDIRRYAALRLAANLLRNNPAYFDTMARTELDRACPLTRQLCHQIIDEVEFLNL